MLEERTLLEGKIAIRGNSMKTILIASAMSSMLHVMHA